MSAGISSSSSPNSTTTYTSSASSTDQCVFQMSVENLNRTLLLFKACGQSMVTCAEIALENLQTQHQHNELLSKKVEQLTEENQALSSEVQRLNRLLGQGSVASTNEMNQAISSTSSSSSSGQSNTVSTSSSFVFPGAVTRRASSGPFAYQNPPIVLSSPTPSALLSCAWGALDGGAVCFQQFSHSGGSASPFGVQGGPQLIPLTAAASPTTALPTSLSQIVGTPTSFSPPPSHQNNGAQNLSLPLTSTFTTIGPFRVHSTNEELSQSDPLTDLLTQRSSSSQSQARKRKADKQLSPDSSKIKQSKVEEAGVNNHETSPEAETASDSL